MLYILLCSVVLLIVVIGTVARATLALVSPSPGQRLQQMVLVLVSYAVGMAYCAPLLYLFFGPDGAPGKTLGVDNARLTVYLLFAASVTLLFYIPLLWKIAAKSRGFWPMGQLTLVALACFVGGKSAYDHLTFFNNDQAGWADIALMKEIGEITDMPGCTSPVAFVRFQSSGPFEYRCPGLIVFNRLSSQPFGPWPHNDSGSSQQLADVILKIKNEAKVPDEFPEKPAHQ